jgi:hypothetical protein
VTSTVQANGAATKHTSEFLNARVHIPNTCKPCARSVGEFAAWCQSHNLAIIKTVRLLTDDYGGAAEVPLARHIYEFNTQMLRSADGALADLQEWHDHEPDSDTATAFEVGCAAALELTIVAYGAR